MKTLFLLNLHPFDMENLIIYSGLILIIIIGIIVIVREDRKEKRSYSNPLILDNKSNGKEFHVRKKETGKVFLNNWEGCSRWYLTENIPNEYLIPEKYFKFIVDEFGVRKFKELSKFSRRGL